MSTQEFLTADESKGIFFISKESVKMFIDKDSAVECIIGGSQRNVRTAVSSKSIFVHETDKKYKTS